MKGLVIILFEIFWSIEDCRKQKINRGILLTGILTGIGYAVFGCVTGTATIYAAAAGLLPGSLLLAYGILTEGKVGRADGYMVMILGLFLGWELCTAILSAACLLTAVYAGIGLLLKKLSRSAKISFAPFLLLATVGIFAVMKAGGGEL